MTLNKIDLQVAYGAVKHFGRNLYTSNPPALGELIANSWDAYCTKCDVFFEGEKLLVVDDGIGMTDEELTTRYAISGTEKNINNIRIPSGFTKRPYMGRKGIGKFSAFSLGDSYILYTKSENDLQWKKIEFDYNLLNKQEAIVPVSVDYINDLGELTKIFSSLTEPKTGTLIYIPVMKRKIISRSITGLKNLISRRFSVNILKDYNFELNINSDKIDLHSHFYDSNLEFIYYFGMQREEIKNRFPHIEEKNIFLEEEEFLDKNSVSGWVGTVELPNQLLADSDEKIGFSGVTVYINGKLADEDILREKLRSRITNAYFVGEVNADFLQNNDEDPVLSSREGLNKELDDVRTLIDRLFKIKKKVDNSWNALRANRQRDKHDYLDKMLASASDLEKAFRFYNDEQQKKVISLSQKIFDNGKKYSDYEYRFYGQAIFALVNSKIINEIKLSDGDVAAEALEKIYNLFDKTELNTALRMKSNIEDRISVIKKLKQIIDTEEIESVFEKHLRENPWLINQYWDKPSNEIVVDTQQRYEASISKHRVAGRTDLIIRTADEPFPIICELKREKLTNYSSPNVEEISDQILKYRRLITNKINKDDSVLRITKPMDIKAYFICGEKAYDKLEVTDIDILKESKIEIFTYQELIRKAERVYSDRIKLEK